MQIDESKIVEKCDEETALACLLASQTCFIDNVNIAKEGEEPIWTVGVYAIVSDIFAWGCSDAEPLPMSEGENPSQIVELYRLQKEKNFWGLVEWACKSRGEQPQFAVKRDMIKTGHWTDELEALSPNSYDEACKRVFGKNKTAE